MHAKKFIPYVGLLLCLVSFFAKAQEDSDCLMCHGDPELTREAEEGSIQKLYIDEALYSVSVHGENGCISCHSDISDLPHEEHLAAVNCGDCHEEQEEYDAGPHGQSLNSGDDHVSGCSDCHGKHDIRPSTDPLSRVHPQQQHATCGKCHSNPALVKEHMISVRNPSESYLLSVHGKAVNDGNMDAPACNDCHGTHDLLPAHDPDSPAYRLNVPETCGKCHPKALEDYKKSIHGIALEKGIPDAPNCTDCHGEHTIESPDDTTSSVNRKQIVRSTCPRCHDDEQVMKRYGIETMRQSSYMDSFHGMASASGSEIVASCVSCHGKHTILGKDNPESSIHPANLPGTCGQCHENAGPNFAKGSVHIMPTAPEQWVLGLVRTIYIVLIVVVIGGMVLHNTLLMFRHEIKKFKIEITDPNAYQRFTKGQTIGHLILTVSFIALALSGFALRYPESWWAQLIFHGETGLAVRGIVHRIAAVALIGLAVLNAIYLLATKNGRKELGALMFRFRDLLELFHNVSYGLGIAKTEPRWDRYSYIEKFEYWGMWWGTVLMIITGLCMWFVNIFLNHFPKLALDVMALIHFYEAWLAVLVIVIWHLYYMIFDPQTYPMNWSWLTGKITEEDFKIRHPREFEKIMRQREPESADVED